MTVGSEDRDIEDRGDTEAIARGVMRIWNLSIMKTSVSSLSSLKNCFKGKLG